MGSQTEEGQPVLVHNPIGPCPGLLGPVLPEGHWEFSVRPAGLSARGRSWGIYLQTPSRRVAGTCSWNPSRWVHKKGECHGGGGGTPTSPATVRPELCPHPCSSPCCNSGPWKDTEQPQRLADEVLPAPAFCQATYNCPARSYRLLPFTGARPKLGWP